jgi:hypothetical protein
MFYSRGNGGRDELLGYSDSVMAGDLDGRKSTSRIIFFTGRSPISWQPAKKKVVALSSCERSTFLLLLLPVRLFGWRGCLLRSEI